MMRKFLHFTSAGIVSVGRKTAAAAAVVGRQGGFGSGGDGEGAGRNVSCGQNSIPTITFPIIIRWQMDTPLCFLRPRRRAHPESARELGNLNCSARGRFRSGNKVRRGYARRLFARARLSAKTDCLSNAIWDPSPTRAPARECPSSVGPALRQFLQRPRCYDAPLDDLQA